MNERYDMENPSMLSSRRQVHTAILLITAALLLGACTGDPQKAKDKYLAAGEKHMKQKQYGDAAVEFRNAIRIDPRFAEAYYQLAQADLAQRDWQGAYASLEKTIELDPRRLDARLDRGRLYIAARQFDKAEEDANSILQEEPKNVGAYQLLGAALTGEEKPDRALESFSKVTELLPNDASSYLNLALVEIRLRRFKDAEEHLRKAIAADPKSLQANIDLANFYHLQNKLPEAQEALQAGIQNNPDAPQLYIDWANILSNAGKTTDADGVLDRLRKQMPKSPEAAIAIGDYYVQWRDLDKALAEYQHGLSIAAGDLDIENRMEELYLISNRTDEASKLDNQLMKQAPNDLIVSVNHGRLLLAQGMQQDALIALQKAVKNAPDSAQAHYYLGVAYWQTEGLGQARSELQEAVKVSPGFPLALQGLAQLNLAQNHASEAQVYAQELVHRFPADVNDRLLLGEIYLREGQSRQADEQFLAASRLAPNQAAVHLGLGQLYYAEKKWTQAEKEFETAMQLDPSNPTMLSPYADFLVARQQAPKAIALAQKFIDAHPSNAQGHLILGSLQFDAKNNSAAEAEFERAIQIEPNNVQGYLRMGRVYQEKNQPDAAIGQYEKALELQPRFAPLVTMVGYLYVDKGDLETARKYFARALEADPNFAEANANMAWVDAQEGKDLDVALGLAQKAKSLKPEVPSISDTLAWVMYKKGNYSGAIPLLQDCVKKNPDSAQFRYHLGLALIAAGQKEPGKAQLEAALQMNKLRAADKQQAQQALGQPN
jgi:cellulose synthase operon protein C